MPRMMNNSQWSEVWNRKIVKLAYFFFNFNMWMSYKKFLAAIRLSPSSKVLELGSGTGKNSMKICSKYACNITLVDSCKIILEKSRALFKSNGMKAEFVLNDIFKLNLDKDYDLVFSDGVAEHFSGDERGKIFEMHRRFVKKNGYVMIIVPRSSKLYWAIRRFSEKLKLWKYIEIPFTKRELLRLCKENNLKPVKILNPFLGAWIGVLAQRKS